MLKRGMRLPSISNPEAHVSSSETQGQIVGAGKNLNGREKNSGEESQETREALLLIHKNSPKRTSHGVARAI